MAQVFISYSSHDYDYAKTIYGVLKTQRIDSWFAPAQIRPGEDFAERIGTELNDEDSLQERAGQLSKSPVFLLILSKGSMRSDWVRKELKLAINKKKALVIAQVDHESLTDEFEYLLVDVQIMDCYHMNRNAVTAIVEAIRQIIGDNTASKTVFDDRKRFSEHELHIQRIACGDPYYEEPHTLTARLSGDTFFLAPPEEILAHADRNLLAWCEGNGFVMEDSVFGTTLASITREIPIPDLPDRIETSRKKVFQQFLNRENGCYFNNKKYGIEDINPFGRTTDAREIPKLELRMFTTDYYTHRVMKDVCKKLVSDHVKAIHEINYSRIGPNKIFLTSLGINLILAEDVMHSDQSILITSRSTNSAETYQQRNISLSVIEGVSISDYDEYQDVVSLSLAAERGLIEELNVTKEFYQANSLRFHELFVNRDNLEIGITCSAELRKEYRLRTDILHLRGKDQELEIADKQCIRVSDLEAFIRTNKEAILPQAMYTFCSFLENNGILMIERYHTIAAKKQTYLCSKRGISEPCGDSFVDGDDFLAVIDGATPKGNRLWNGMKGDVFVSAILSEAIRNLPPEIDASSAIKELNQAVRSQYQKFGIDYESLEPEEQLQASVVIYCVARKEIWSFGDCMIRINQRSYRNIKKGDEMLSDLRAFCIEAAELQNTNLALNPEKDYGREQILPFLKQFTLFANTGKSFGYDVINGGRINPDHVKIYQVQPGDHVVLASDGYPKLFDTLEETEQYLSQSLSEDPLCMYKLRGTKGVSEGNTTYDDRCFVGFTVEP